MSTESPWQLVVIDDSVRFAFHVWRYLGRSIGIGGEDRSANFWDAEGETPSRMDTADGRAAVWWVPGDRKMEKSLAAVIAALGPGQRFFLIDMRGQPADDSDGPDEPLGLRTLDWLSRHAPDVDFHSDVMMVSSYETGVVPLAPKPLRIWPKSPETLARLAARMPAPAEKPIATRGLHILVTGAGFEMRNDSTGGFGLPPTADLLGEMGPPFDEPDLTLRRKGPLPYPSCKNKKEAKDWQEISNSQDMDAWWNYLLERELRRITSIADAQSRNRTKMLASARERDLREAFRRILLNYDRGHLNQTLEAAKQGWHTWLTTNYTRFADRAIALAETRAEGTAPGPWQIVSTSIEALSLSRQILHGGSSWREKKSRHLFKLHGDIAHLQTMATAGQDKEFFSSLSLPIDSLHQVYFAAETFLGYSLQAQKDVQVVWHVVGHRLNDWLLCRLIAQVCTHTNPESTDFVVVSRDPTKTKEKLQSFLRDTSPGFEERVAGYPATAEQYMARIARNGGLPEIGEKDWVRGWLLQLGATSYGTQA
jgi:hypothetical protein